MPSLAALAANTPVSPTVFTTDAATPLAAAALAAATFVATATGTLAHATPSPPPQVQAFIEHYHAGRPW